MWMLEARLSQCNYLLKPYLCMFVVFNTFLCCNKNVASYVVYVASYQTLESIESPKREIHLFLVTTVRFSQRHFKGRKHLWLYMFLDKYFFLMYGTPLLQKLGWPFIGSASFENFSFLSVIWVDFSTLAISPSGLQIHISNFICFTA